MTSSATSARTGRLETAAFAFPSDLADEGVDAVLRNLQERAGLDGIQPAFVYHAARDLFPHNPRRKVHLLDRGGHFFLPDPTLYDGLRIQPRVDPSATERDVLRETCERAAERGLAVNAWTVFLHADRPDELPDCVVRNAFGEPYANDFCPANPDVRAYTRALVADVARYDVDSIVAESLHYHGLEHGYHHERYFIELGATARYLLGICFCEHCLARADTAGVAGSVVREAVEEELVGVFESSTAVRPGQVEREALGLLADGELAAYLDVRNETVTSLAAEAAEVSDAHGKRFAFLELAGAVKGYADGKPTGEPAAEIAWRLGVDLPGVAAVCPEVEVLGYAADVERLRQDLEAYRACLGDARLSLALRPSPPDCDSPDNLAAKIGLARAMGVARVDFYHYGFLRLEALDWIRSALEAERDAVT